jgi:hypothetical protein
VASRQVTDGKRAQPACPYCGMHSYHQPAVNEPPLGGELPSQRTIKDKIARLRERLKQAPIDANVRAILLGILDLLGDEL